MMRPFLIVGICFIFGCRSSGLEEATKEGWHRCEGSAMVVKGDTAAARKAAIDDALRKCVEQEAGVLLESNSAVQDAQSVYNIIRTESRGFVDEYKVIDEKESPGRYSVTVSARVSETRLFSAFSERVTKFKEENLIGPCSMMILLYGASNQVQLLCDVNDPTLKTDSVLFLPPGGGRAKPAAYGTPSAPILRADWSGSGSTAFSGQDMLQVFRSGSLEVEFVSPSDGSRKTMKAKVVRVMIVAIRLPNHILQLNTPALIEDLSPQDRQTIISALEEVSR